MPSTGRKYKVVLSQGACHTFLSKREAVRFARRMVRELYCNADVSEHEAGTDLFLAGEHLASFKYKTQRLPRRQRAPRRLGPTEAVASADRVLTLLREAMEQSQRAGSVRTTERIALSISSAKGAKRHAENMAQRMREVEGFESTDAIIEGAHPYRNLISRNASAAEFEAFEAQQLPCGHQGPANADGEAPVCCATCASEGEG